MHLLILALILGLFVHDGMDPRPGTDLPLAEARVVLSLLAVVLLPKFAIGAIFHAACRWVHRRLARSGAVRRSLRRLDVIRIASCIGVVASYAIDLWSGALTGLRRALGDGVLHDELLFLAPTLATLTWMWAAYYPIDRRLRESAILRRLDQGEPLPPLWTRRQFVVHQLRHQVALVLLPLLMVMAWNDAIDLGRRHDLLDLSEGWFVALQLSGVGLVVALAPLVIRHVWDTAPLPPGPLRDRLVAMCRRHRVRVRELLLWRTFGGMINAAVMGFVAPFRYILLTDALLDRVPQAQVEAVMAHELAHVRRKHMFWLLLAAGGMAIGLEIGWQMLHATVTTRGPILVDRAGGVMRAGLFEPMQPWLGSPDWIAWAVLPVLAGAWVAAFGWLSRRYERQADTFAVQHMVAEQEHPQRDGLGRPLIDSGSAMTMIQALQQVADLNHIDPHKASWRHGSIAWRQEYLHSLIGQPAHALPIDRLIRRINLGALLLAACIAVVQMLAPQAL